MSISNTVALLFVCLLTGCTVVGSGETTTSDVGTRESKSHVIPFDAASLPTIRAELASPPWKPLQVTPTITGSPDRSRRLLPLGDVLLSREGCGAPVSALEWDFVLGLPNDQRGSIWFVGREFLRGFALDDSAEAHRAFGSCLAWGPDLNDDGVCELLVGAPGDADVPGRVFALDVLTESLVQVIAAPDDQPSFGATVCAVADLDGDGARDIAVGRGSVESESGRIGLGVRLFAGGSGELLTTPRLANLEVGMSPAPHGRGSLTWAPGVNADAPGLLLICQPNLGFGRLDAVSLPSGEPRWSIEGSHRFLNFGTCLLPFTDVDGDGVRDVLVGSPRRSSGSQESKDELAAARGVIRLVSGATGGTIYELREPEDCWRGIDWLFGHALVRYPDQDGDGVEDFLLGSTFDMWSGTLFFVSGKTGVPFKAVRFGQSFEGLYQVGHRLALGSDWDGDGRPEVCTTTVYPMAGAHAFGVLSPANGMIYAEVSDRDLWPFIAERTSTPQAEEPSPRR